MSIKEFWDEAPELLWAYRKSYMDQFKVQTETNNYNAWLSGLYIYNAISISLYNSFGRKEGQPIQNYMEEPIDFNKKPKSQEEIEKENRLKLEEDIKDSINRMKKALKSG